MANKEMNSNGIGDSNKNKQSGAKSSNAVMEVVRNYMEERCASDPILAIKYANPAKSLEKALNYVAHEVQKSGLTIMDSDSVFDLILHYYDENLEDVPNVNCKIAVAKELTDSERAEAKEQTVTEQHDQTPAKETSTAIKMAPVDPNKVDWDTIEKQWGIKRDDLEKSGAMQQMVYNHKSPQLFTLKPEIGGEKFEAQARLSFKSNPDGSFTLTPHFVKHEPQLDKAYKGYSFTDEDKAQLRKTGNLGRPVDLTDPKTGEVKKSLVSIDRLTNEIESIPVDKIYIKNKVANIELDMKQIGILKDGGIIREQHIELPNGRKFTADLQYNADKRDVVFVNSEQYRQKREQSQEQGGQQYNSWLDKEGNIKNLTKWKGVPLSETAQADYRAGKQIMVGEIPDRNGNPFTVYLQFDPEKQRPKQTYVYPDKEKVVGIASESKTQYAVNNEGKTNEPTKGVKEPLQRGQTEPKNEEQKKQQKPKGPKL